MSELENFKKDVSDLVSHFLNEFKDWVSDFEDLSKRQKKYSAISPKFLEHISNNLVKAFDDLLTALDDSYAHLILEHNKLSSVEKKKKTEEALIQFKEEAISLIQRANVKAEVLLNDFSVTPFSQDLRKKLEIIEKLTYADFLKHFEK